MDSRPLDPQAFKTQLFAQFGRLGHALSSPRRLELLDLLCQAERSVEELCSETGLSPSNVSQHLRILKECRLVELRQDGLHHRYHLADPALVDFWRGFRQIAVSQLPGVRELMRDIGRGEDGGLERIEAPELLARLAQGDVVLLDVRPEPEHGADRLPGARSLPLVDLVRRLDELPRDKELVAYCRGPYCIMAREAVRLLRAKGYRARRLEDGVPEWRARGNPVETGPARA